MSILEAFLAGKEARRHADAAEQVNALQQFVGKNGQAIMGGDPNALGQLAGFGVDGLNMAMGVQENVYNRQRQEAQDARATKVDARADQQWQMQLEEYAASKTAAERAAEAAKIEEAVKAGLMAKTPQEWDALATSMGATDLVGQFDNREALAARAMTMAEVLKMTTPEPYKPQSGPGKVAADIAAGVIPPGTVDAPGVVVNTGENGSEFNKTIDKKAAERFDGYVSQGVDAQRMVGDIKALADLAGAIGTGKAAQLTAALGPYAEAVGIDIAGLDEGQAFQSIVDRMAPAMRTPGAGASSDFDAKQFLSSLPQLGRTPEGNAIIMETLGAIQQHKIAVAEIAQQAMLPPGSPGAITWQEADKKIAALGNPYDGFNSYRKQSGIAKNAPVVIDGFTIEAIE